MIVSRVKCASGLPEARSYEQLALQVGLTNLRPVAGLEPATSRLVGGCSLSLGPNRLSMEDLALRPFPLSYTRLKKQEASGPKL